MRREPVPHSPAYLAGLALGWLLLALAAIGLVVILGGLGMVALWAVGAI